MGQDSRQGKRRSSGRRLCRELICSWSQCGWKCPNSAELKKREGVAESQSPGSHPTVKPNLLKLIRKCVSIRRLERISYASFVSRWRYISNLPKHGYGYMDIRSRRSGRLQTRMKTSCCPGNISVCLCGRLSVSARYEETRMMSSALTASPQFHVG